MDEIDKIGTGSTRVDPRNGNVLRDLEVWL